MKGLGIDLCSVERMEQILARHEAFPERWFTAQEREYIRNRGKMGAQSAAAMFAAKEAFLKAVGTGIGRGVVLTEIEVIHDELGAPKYAFFGVAKQKMDEVGAQGAWLSLSHEAGVAAAVCVIE